MKPLAIGAAIILALAIGGAGGWTAQGWRKDAAVAASRQEQTQAIADQAQAALGDLATAADRVRKAADQYASIQTTFGAKLDQLRKDFRDVQKNAPLPADCKPDLARVRHLEAAIEAANAAAAR
jgi:hypothetical protein